MISPLSSYCIFNDLLSKSRSTVPYVNLNFLVVGVILRKERSYLQSFKSIIHWNLCCFDAVSGRSVNLISKIWPLVNLKLCNVVIDILLLVMDCLCCWELGSQFFGELI